MKRLAIALVVLTVGYCAEINGAASEATAITTPVASIEVADPFVATLTRFRASLEELDYSAKRNAAWFSYNEHETLKALHHLMMLTERVGVFGVKAPEGKEAFYLMKQPISYINQFLPHNPLFSHVVTIWDQSLSIYGLLVQAFTGKPVSGSDPVDFQSPEIKTLQSELYELKELANQFESQMKRTFPILNADNQALIAYTERFARVIGSMHASSLSFLTRKYEMEAQMREATEISRQISAGLLYHPNQYFGQSWGLIRDKANAMQKTFRSLMGK